MITLTYEQPFSRTDRYSDEDLATHVQTFTTSATPPEGGPPWMESYSLKIEMSSALNILSV